MATNDYGNLTAVSAIVNGQEVLEAGLDFLFTITYPDNMSTTNPGLNGVYVELNSITTATAVINVMPNSLANAAFWDIYYNQRGALGGLTSMTLVDEVGNTHDCQKCSLQGPAETVAGAQDADQRKWTFGIGLANPPKS